LGALGQVPEFTNKLFVLKVESDPVVFVVLVESEELVAGVEFVVFDLSSSWPILLQAANTNIDAIGIK
jgi:hypothetical protein